MSDQQTEAIEVEATEMGWVPKEKFRGEETRWVDAATFVERGHTVLPIVKKKNAELQASVAALQAETKRMSDLFTASQESIKALQEFHSANTKKQVESARAALLAELKQAKRDGDVDLEVDIQEKLNAATEALKEAPAKVEAPAQPANAAIDPVTAMWIQTNPWYGKEPRQTSLANSIANALRADPENDGLTGAAFFATVDAELALRRNGMQHSKVGSGSHSGDGGSGRTTTPTYADLNPEAKKVCDAEAKKFVGEGKMYKTIAEWRNYYASAVLGA
jgi:hypothetical protein